MTDKTVLIVLHNRSEDLKKAIYEIERACDRLHIVPVFVPEEKLPHIVFPMLPDLPMIALPPPMLASLDYHLAAECLEDIAMHFGKVGDIVQFDPSPTILATKLNYQRETRKPEPVDKIPVPKGYKRNRFKR